MPAPPSSGPAFTMSIRAGRVIEARIFGLRTVDHANAYALVAQVLRVPRDVRPVLCADHRPVAIYPQPVADRLVQLFVQMSSCR